MLPPHFVCVKDCNKPCWRRSLLHACSSACFLALNQAHHTNNLETEIPRGFDCLNRRGSCRADIIHNHKARPFFPKALNSMPGTVLLVRLADQKSVQLAARDRHGGQKCTGAHGHSAVMRNEGEGYSRADGAPAAQASGCRPTVPASRSAGSRRSRRRLERRESYCTTCE